MSSSNGSTPNSNGGNGKAKTPEIDQGREAFEIFQRMFADVFAQCYNADASNVTAMPIDNLVRSVKLGKPTNPDAMLVLNFPRELAKQFKLQLDDPAKDLMVFVHIPRAAVDDLSKPALVVGADGKKLA